MPVYEIVGQIDTITLKSSYGEDWKGLCLTPPFQVTADSKTAALRIAEDIIDPLHLCTMHLTAEEASPVESAEKAQLNGELDNAVEALAGDSNDAEHDALFSMAGTVAAILGLDLYELLKTADEGDEE